MDLSTTREIIRNGSSSILFLAQQRWPFMCQEETQLRSVLVRTQPQSGNATLDAN